MLCTMCFVLTVMVCQVPPLPLLGNASVHLWNALFFHPSTKKFAEFMRELFAIAEYSGQWCGIDGHPANDKVHTHLVNTQAGSEAIPNFVANIFYS